MKNNDKIQALLNFGTEINTMALVYTANQGLNISLINIGAQKVNGSNFQTFCIILASFKIDNKLYQSRFF